MISSYQVMNNIFLKGYIFIEKIIVTIFNIFIFSNFLISLSSGIEESLKIFEKLFTDYNSQEPGDYILNENLPRMIFSSVVNLFYIIGQGIYILNYMFGAVNQVVNEIARLILSSIREITIVRLARIIYLHGPRYGPFGFWKGKAKEDICGELFSVDGAFWREHPEQCNKNIEKEINSAVLFIEASCIGYMALKYFKNKINHIF